MHSKQKLIQSLLITVTAAGFILPLLHGGDAKKKINRSVTIGVLTFISGLVIIVLLDYLTWKVHGDSFDKQTKSA